MVLLHRNNSKSYRHDVDGLRAIAILAVLGNHFAENTFPNGYLGVDLFFVISGFVISSSLLSRKMGSFKDFLVGFYARRIKRIYPALLAYVIVVSIFLCLLVPAPFDFLKTGFYSIFGVSNFYINFLRVDYFADVINENPFLITWSLAVEEQFYFIYPALVFGCLKCFCKGTGTKSTRDLDRRMNMCATVLLVFAVLSFVWWKTSSTTDLGFSYFMMPTRFWELAAGGILFFGLNKFVVNRNPSIVANAFSIVLLLSIVLILFYPFGLPIVRATTLIVLLTSGLILSTKNSSYAEKLLSLPVMLFIGAISYSLYLWHAAVISFSAYTVGNNFASLWWQLPLTFLLAYISYLFVETRFRYSSAIRSVSSMQILKYGMLASFGTAISILFLYRPIIDRFYIGNLNFRHKTIQNKYGEHIDLCNPRREFSNTYVDRCLTNPVDIGENFSQKSAVLIGDSYARHYLNAIVSALSGQNYKVMYLTMGWGCGFRPVDMMPNSEINCLQYVNDVRHWIMNNTKEGDIVFIGQNPTGKARDSYFTHLENFAFNLNKKGVNMVQLDGTAPPTANVSLCLEDRWSSFNPNFLGQNHPDCWLERSNVKNKYQNFESMLQDRLANYSNNNWYYIPLREGLCSTDYRCGMKTSSGSHIWVDNGHITPDSSSELGPLLKFSLLKYKIIDNK